MSRRHHSHKGRVRRALPDLRGKDVELVSIERERFLSGHMYHVRLFVDGLPYHVTRHHTVARDELDVMRWLIRLQGKGSPP